MSGEAAVEIPKPKKYDFHICMSFAEEDRPFVEETAECLERAGLHIYIYTKSKVKPLGQNLRAKLADIYKNRAKYCVVFISQHYANSPWARFELDFAQDRAMVDPSYILYGRFDETTL